MLTVIPWSLCTTHAMNRVLLVAPMSRRRLWQLQGGFEINGGQTVTVFSITNLVPGPKKKYAAPESTSISNSCEQQLAYFLVGSGHFKI